MSLQDVGDALGVDVQTVRRWIKGGRLRAFKPGKEYRIREADLEEFLQAREVRPKAGAQPSPKSEERLHAVRETFGPVAEGLERHCERWEEKISSSAVEPEDVEDFVAFVENFRDLIGLAYTSELWAIADALGLVQRAGEQTLSGVPREKVDAGVDAQLQEHSQMHAAIRRHFGVGRRLAEATGDTALAKEMGEEERKYAPA